MITTALRRLSMAFVLLPWLFAAPTRATEAFTCKLDYDMKGWSAIYSTAQGSGIVACTDGSTMKVTLDAKGGGLTAGKSHIDEGHGTFIGVHKIGDVLGDYAAAGASGGVARSGETAVVTKGDITLTLSGTGTGWNAGVGFSRFSIKPGTATHS